MTTPRRKNRLEKFFSFKRHWRRRGSKKILRDNADFARIKEVIIDAQEQSYTHGSSDSVEEHASALRGEFHGQSELLYHHAKLIVLLRRRYREEEVYRDLKRLWQQETRFLLKNLNTRWLVAAADSFVDHDHDPMVRAQAFAASCLVNTVKLYETERFLNESVTKPSQEARIRQIQESRLALFDGISGFAVGTDDTLRNMRWRLDDLASQSIAGNILLEVFQRLQEHDTCYARFRALHTRKRTSWW